MPSKESLRIKRKGVTFREPSIEYFMPFVLSVAEIVDIVISLPEIVKTLMFA